MWKCSVNLKWLKKKTPTQKVYQEAAESIQSMVVACVHTTCVHMSKLASVKWWNSGARLLTGIKQKGDDQMKNPSCLAQNT